MKKFFVFFAAAAFFFPVLTFAETLVLKSGKSVEGRIIEDTEQVVKLDVEGVSLTFYRDEIEKVEKGTAPTPEDKMIPAAGITELKTEEDAGKWLTFYYQHKDTNNVIPALKILLRDKEKTEDLDHASPVIHLFAAILKDNPSLISQVNDLAGQYTGNQKELLLKTVEEAENFRSPFPRDPNDLDCLWSEFLVSGEPRPVKKIISVLTYMENDMDLTSLVWRRMKIDSREMALKLLQGTAGWSLNSNAKQHKKVYDVIEQEIQTTNNPDLKEKLMAVLEK